MFPHASTIKHTVSYGFLLKEGKKQVRLQLKQIQGMSSRYLHICKLLPQVKTWLSWCFNIAISCHKHQIYELFQTTFGPQACRKSGAHVINLQVSCQIFPKAHLAPALKVRECPSQKLRTWGVDGLGDGPGCHFFVGSERRVPKNFMVRHHFLLIFSQNWEE